MRQINLLLVHCSATPEGRDVSAAEIDRWHKQRGWNGIGYHYVIRLDGTVEPGRPAAYIGAHCRGYNANSLGICLAGGMDKANKKAKNTFTQQQLASLRSLLVGLKHIYPQAIICGHRDMSPDADGDGIVERHEWVKECPSFDVREWAKSVNLI